MTDLAGRAGLPFRIDFEQQRKRAKELLRGLREAEPWALSRWRAHGFHAAGGTVLGNRPTFRLADAQRVIARELGLPGWPALKEHAGALARSRRAIAADPAPDGDRPTLHVRCGSDICETLREAGFVGDFLEYADPVCHGPVPEAADLPALRARFIAEAYGRALALSEATVLNSLRRAEEALARAAEAYDRVVLWFEHDSYDQLVLARCLAALREAGVSRSLELVSVNRFPGSARFIGLGQLPPEALRMLWHARRPLGRADLDLGSRAWDALRSADPTALAAIGRSPAAGLPDLAPALLRHLRELPWTADGLSLTERLTLGILSEGGHSIGTAFSRLMREREPLPWLGDVMFLAVVEAMGRAAAPPFRGPSGAPELPWPQHRLELTDAGRAVLEGRADWLSLGPEARWVGGVRIVPGEPAWRWDEAAKAPLRS
ncbi:DUF1835 domain-containing protein [Arenibaculum pallidiluteum]|uniref:DUF1835 domain-containing protein n=1 Tax=Arenibaculum pallidiluteum TaxID=2812559 RepID=UPI001A963587|nr:DUF1835 domain-containing protein [Arenibaculum pallidiluteum]